MPLWGEDSHGRDMRAPSPRLDRPPPHNPSQGVSWLTQPSLFPLVSTTDHKLQYGKIRSESSLAMTARPIGNQVLGGRLAHLTSIYNDSSFPQHVPSLLLPTHRQKHFTVHHRNQHQLPITRLTAFVQNNLNHQHEVRIRRRCPCWPRCRSNPIVRLAMSRLR